MGLFEFELLKIKENLFFQILFVCSIALILFLSLSFYSEDILNYSVSIGYIDEDLSDESAEYIKKLENKDILELVKLSDKEQGLNLLKDSKIEAFVVIPKGYFKDILKLKLEYNYLEYSVIAPAIIDLFADELMLPISKQKLLQATTNYMSKEWESTALKHYNYFVEQNSFFLDTDLHSYGNSSGLNEKYDANKIELGRNILGFGCAIIILILVFSLVLSEFKNSDVIYRSLSINGLYFRVFMTQRFFDYMKLAIIWSLLSIIVGRGISLKSEHIVFMAVFGMLIIGVYYEFISLMYRIFNKSHIGNLISVGFVMLSAIFGGAYFPTDIFPEAYGRFLSWIPFYQLNEFYYSRISGLSTMSTLFYILVYLVFLISMLILNYRYYSISNDFH